MSVVAFPGTLRASKMSWALQPNVVTFRSAFGAQAVAGGVPQWVVSMESVPMTDMDSCAWKGWLMQLRGMLNQAELWDMVRPAPLGTLRGTLTFSQDAAQGDTTININGGYDGAGKSLLAGDLLGFGSGTTQQVAMVTEAVTADTETRSLFLDFVNDVYSAGAPGEFSLSVQPPLRNAFSAGAAVTWDKPKALFRRQDSSTGWDYQPGMIVGPIALKFIEDWRP